MGAAPSSEATGVPPATESAAAKEEARPAVEAKTPAPPGSCEGAGEQIVKAAPAALVWATFSFSLSYYNSWLLNRSHERFPFPIFYTFWHMVTQGLGMQVVFALRPEWQRPSWAQFSAQWRLLLGMAIISMVSIGGENSALTQVTLTVHESVKSAVPILTMILAFVFEGRWYKPMLIVAVIGLAACTGLVTTGAVIQGHATASNTLAGILLTVMASCAAAARPVIFALLMRKPTNGGQLFSSPLVVVWYEAVFGGPLYIITWLLSEERTTSLAFIAEHPGTSIGYNAAGCAMALFYAVALNELINVTSSLTTTVLGTAKHVVMATIAAAFVDKILFSGDVLLPVFGLVGYVPSTLLYAYLMPTHQGYEPWSYKASASPYVFGFASCLRRCCGSRPTASESSALLPP